MNSNNPNDDRQQDRDESTPFHERITILKNQGYRGFSITKSESKWDGIEVTATSESGDTLKASGETGEEAYKKLIDQIDFTLDES